MMLFKLFNALASFQDYIIKIMAKKLDILVIIYLNNIPINMKNPSQSYIKAVK